MTPSPKWTRQPHAVGCEMCVVRRLLPLLRKKKRSEELPAIVLSQTCCGPSCVAWNSSNYGVPLNMNVRWRCRMHLTRSCGWAEPHRLPVQFPVTGVRIYWRVAYDDNAEEKTSVVPRTKPHVDSSNFSYQGPWCSWFILFSLSGSRKQENLVSLSRFARSFRMTR